MAANIRRIEVEADLAGRRLDRALADVWPDLSRSRLQALIRDGRLSVDGAALCDPSFKVRAGAQVTLEEPPAAAPEPQGEAISLAVVYEDGDLIVVDKPAGLVVHPAPGHDTGTLVNALIAHCGTSLSGIGGIRRPGIVHRLDKNTSGLLVAAKNDATHRGLSAQFADHGRSGPLERSYLALVWGSPEPSRGSVVAPIERSPRNREKMAVAPEHAGRHAVTHYAVEEVFAGSSELATASLVRCRLETGRTHQVRVHLAHIGYPLLGDETYGAGFRTKAHRLFTDARAALEALGRQALHAAVLGFEHPRSKQAMRFESPLPAPMAALLEALREGR